MSFVVNAREEETFNLVTDYLNGKHMRILKSEANTHIEAEFGSIWSLSPSNEKGIAEIQIVKETEGSLVNIKLDFSSTVVLALAVTVATAIILFSFLTNISGMDAYRSAFLAFGLLPALLLTIAFYSFSATRKGFLEDFRTFMQSLQSKKNQVNVK
jgi:hypothetical protein